MSYKVLFITKNYLGESSVELGEILMKSFLGTIIEKNNFDEIVLVNSAVKLVCEGANTIEDLSVLNDKSPISICQTCLNYYELDDKVEVGNKSNMHKITDALLNANVVTI